MDAVKNFAKIVVSAGYDSSAVSITLQDGDGAKLPTPATDGEFNLVWWNFTDYPDPTDDAGVEIVRCIAKAGDVITVVRAQEETHASDKNLFNKKYKMILALTKKMMDDIALELMSKLMNIVEDLTPQLGGNLDLQTNLLTGEGGTEGISINSSGNVGIGTTSPGRRLHVHKGSTPGIKISDSVATEGVLFGLSGSHSPYIWGCEDSDFYLGTNAIERVRVKNDGNVGIGTNAPTAKLHVSNNNVWTAKFINTDVSSPSAGAGIIAYSDGGSAMGSGHRLGFMLLGGSTNTTHAEAISAGLQSYTTEAWSPTAAGADLRFEITLNGTINRSEAMRINNIGNVGIGTNAPTEKLDINSDAIRLRTAKTPATADAPGNTGDVCWDANYIYICISTNSWHRAAHATW